MTPYQIAPLLSSGESELLHNLRGGSPRMLKQESAAKGLMAMGLASCVAGVLDITLDGQDVLREFVRCPW